MIEVGRLYSDTASFGETDCPHENDINNDIRTFILQKNYPCVAAIQSVVRNDYVIGTYGQFGTGTHWHKLRTDLITNSILRTNSGENFRCCLLKRSERLIGVTSIHPIRTILPFA